MQSLESHSRAPGKSHADRAAAFAQLRLRYGGLLAACAAGIAVLAWFGLIDRSATCAFADVQEQVRSTFGEVRGNAAQKQRARRRGHRRRIERHYPRRHLVLGRYLHRTEVLDADGQIESVGTSMRDGQVGGPRSEGEALPDSRQSGRDRRESGKRTETTIEASPKADLYTEIRKIPAEATTRLPAKMIGDKQVVGFVWEQKIEKTNGTDTWKRTYWVNPVTKLPVRC